jgi:SET domain-containing protein
MLLVKTKIGPSQTHGIGLFADQFIPKGTVTWKYDPNFDPGYSEEMLNSFPKPAKDFVLYYAYFDKDLKKYIMCCDNQRYINHSTTNENILSTPRQDIAARDIQPGEEMLCDYNKFDDMYFERIGLPPEKLKV